MLEKLIPRRGEEIVEVTRWRMMRSPQVWKRSVRFCGGKGEARLRPWVMETAQAPGNEAELAAPVRGEVLLPTCESLPVTGLGQCVPTPSH